MLWGNDICWGKKVLKNVEKKIEVLNITNCGCGKNVTGMTKMSQLL